MKHMLGALLFSIAAFMMIVTSPTSTSAQTYTDLYNLQTSTGDPAYPIGAFAQGRDGNLYSTSSGGGANSYGSVFQMTPSGNVNVLHSFTGVNAQGGQPTGGLTLGTDGNFYGTSVADGTGGAGTIFKIATDGTFTVLHNFNPNTEGTTAPMAPIQATDGNFYGVLSDGNNFFGAVYKMTASGNFTIIYKFTGTQGGAYRYPYSLLQGADGNLYGTTIGTSGRGMVFKMSRSGKLTVLHTFTGVPDGQAAYALMQASDGNFYGTTKVGGVGWGTVYKITPKGVLTILFNFHETDGLGNQPVSGLVEGTDGNLYGATWGGGAHLVGSVYQITKNGNLTLLYSNSSTTGTHPAETPLPHTGGTFYSADYEGGTGAVCICGVLYSLDMGLGPFVTFTQAQSVAKVGKSIGILGQGFTGTSSVKFGSGSASFTVVSDTFLTAKVPSAGTTGTITVATPSGTLTSNRIFKVLPTVSSFTPTSGPVGTQVTITGSGFIGTTKVTFGGVKATSYTVDSGTQITATVPTGAKTGPIAVTTPGGSSSKKTFTVTP